LRWPRSSCCGGNLDGHARWEFGHCLVEFSADRRTTRRFEQATMRAPQSYYGGVEFFSLSFEITDLGDNLLGRQRQL
jgi:hypothetical protein